MDGNPVEASTLTLSLPECTSFFSAHVSDATAKTQKVVSMLNMEYGILYRHAMMDNKKASLL